MENPGEMVVEVVMVGTTTLNELDDSHVRDRRLAALLAAARDEYARVRNSEERP